MDVFEQWIFFPEIWLILGILLIAADVLIGTAFFALSIGVAALIIAALLFIQDESWLGTLVIFETWRGIGTWFAILSLASVGIIKVVFQRNEDDDSDINKY